MRINFSTSNKKEKKLIGFLSATIIVFSSFFISDCSVVKADENKNPIDGYMFELGEDSKYKVELNGDRKSIEDGTQLGDLSIKGSVNEIEEAKKRVEYG